MAGKRRTRRNPPRRRDTRAANRLASMQRRMRDARDPLARHRTAVDYLHSILRHTPADVRDTIAEDQTRRVLELGGRVAAEHLGERR